MLQPEEVLAPSGGAPRASTRDRVRRLLPALLPLTWFLWTGWRGIDYGVHWDEHRQLQVLQHMRESGTLLPGNYWYGGVVHWLGAAVAAPELLDGWAEAASTGTDAEFARFLKSPEFRLRWRTWFLVASSLSILWAYLAALSWRGSALEGLLAACFLGFSWELAYHARWPLPDVVATQFAGLCLAGLLPALVRRSPAWLWLAATAAGLATGTKYPLGLLLVPVLLAGWLVSEQRGSRRLRVPLAAAAIFALVYLLTTPGTLLEPASFWRDLVFQFEHYGDRGHATYTVEPGLEHAGLAARYLGLTLLSPWPALAVAASLLALAGAVAVTRRMPAVGLCLLAFPVLDFAYLSTQRVLIVRNLLPIAPFLALFAAHGAVVLGSLLRPRPLRIALALFVSGLLAANAWWLGRAAESVARRGDEAYFLQELVEHVESRPEATVLLSPRVLADLERLGLARPESAVGVSDARADEIALYASEVGDFWSLPANRPGLVDRVFGPSEVHFDHYPSWWGQDRVLCFTSDRAEELGLLDPTRSRDELLLFRQAWMLQGIGELDGALHRYGIYLREHPEDAQARFNLAYALLELSRHQEALAAFELVLDEKPDYHEVHLHRATCLEALGEVERARVERAIYESSR